MIILFSRRKTFAMPRAAALGATLCAALAGCATAYRTPEAPLPDRYGALSVTVQKTRTPIASATYAASDVVADPWWRDFGDPRLGRMVADALTRNRDLIGAGLKLERARSQIEQTRNQNLPTASGSIGASDSEPIRDSGPGQNTRSASLSVAYEVDLWGRLRASTDAARFQAGASAEDRESAALSVVGQVCDLYWQLGDVNARIARGEASLDAAQRIRRLVEAQYRAGAVSKLEWQQSEQNLQQQIFSRSQLRQQRDELRLSLAALRDGEAWPENDEPQGLDANTLPLDPGLPAELLGRRPDLRAAEWRLRQTLAQSDAARLSVYPALNLTLSASASGDGFANLLDHPVRTLSRSLLLPFLDANGARLKIAVARKDYEIAVNGFEQSLTNALLEVEKGLAARDTLKAQVESSRKTLAAAVEVERLYGVRYRAGAAGLKLWLEAQQSRRGAENSLAQSVLSLRRNDVFLAKALGGSPRKPQAAA